MSDSANTPPPIAGSLLGTNAKSSTPPTDWEARRSRQESRATRFELQSIARGLFLDAGRLAGLDHPANWHRTAKCKHFRHTAHVSVLRSREHQTAFYAGLTTCGSVWACPVCTAKIQERRREEIAACINWAHGRGVQSAMVTLTFPHRAGQKLSVLLERQSRALRFLRSGSPWKRLAERHEYEGLIRALEVTHGVNGWHLHTHEMWLVASWVDAERLRVEVLTRWRAACARAGLLDLSDPHQVAAFDRHSVDVRGHCSASDYLAKMDSESAWGIDRELAKSSTKSGKASGSHPFALLAAAPTSRRAGRLFLAYAIGMKGKRQLFWSPGLKDRVGINERTDEELADELREPADLLGLLGREEWETVRAAKARADVLDAAEAGGWNAVQELIERLTRREIARLEGLLRSLRREGPAHAMRTERRGSSEADPRSESSAEGVHCVARMSV